MTEQSLPLETPRSMTLDPPAAPSEAPGGLTRSILAYSAPMLGMGFMGLLMGIYLMKFSTDVLLIPPASMGLLFGISRIWDAVSDPVAGFLTDRTRTRWGRRRPWMLAGAIPMGAAMLMIWSPPSALVGTPLLLWMGVAIVLFYTASTMVDVPHSALGAELSDQYDDRTRVFGWKRIVFGAGTMFMVAAIGAFDYFPDARLTGSIVAVAGAVIAISSVLYTTVSIRERPDYQGRGAANPYAALADIWSNVHARILIGVFCIQQLGIVMLTASIPFLSEYVLRTPEYTFVYIGLMLFSSIVGVPLWMRLAPYYDKRNLLIASMAAVALIICMFYFAGEGDVIYVCAIAIVAGLAAAGADVISPSIQADIIDYDELHTGQRKEGSYFATWAFAAKTAAGVSAIIIGFVLDSLDFVPNAEQTDSVKFGLRTLCVFAPAVLYTLGVLLFLRFSLTREEHGRIRKELDRRNANANATGEAV